MKKILSYLLVIALVLVQMLPVVNAVTVSGTNANPNTSGSITINNAVSGQTYEIYKLFDLESYSYDNENNNEEGAYTYTIDSNSVWYDFIAAQTTYVKIDAYGEAVGGVQKYIVTWVDGANAATFARLALDYAETNNEITPLDSITASSTTVEFTGLELGYYLVDSSLGALVSLNTTNPVAEIQEKNTTPTVDKDIMEGDQEFDKYNNANIGDTVDYRVTVAAKAGAQNYVLTDTMTDGLTFNNDIVVKVDDEALTEDEDYTIVLPKENDTFTFKVKFTKKYLDTITEDTEIVVTYSATINSDAVINEEGNKNTVKLTYGDGTDVESSVITYVLSFELIKKSSSGTNLEGAKFKLYRSENSTEAIKFVKVTEEGTTYYRVATEDETDTVEEIEVGTVYIKGLDEGTYYLEETVAPDGYNKLTSRVPVKLITNIAADGVTHTTTVETTVAGTTATTSNDSITIKNYTGSLLPSTGGMGTVLFVTIGSIMVLGFGVLLVTKLRLSKMEI